MSVTLATPRAKRRTVPALAKSPPIIEVPVVIPPDPAPQIVDPDAPPFPGAVRFPYMAGFWWVLSPGKSTCSAVGFSVWCCSVMELYIAGHERPFTAGQTEPHRVLHGYWFVPAEPPTR